MGGWSDGCVGGWMDGWRIANTDLMKDGQMDRLMC